MHFNTVIACEPTWGRAQLRDRGQAFIMSSVAVRREVVITGKQETLLPVGMYALPTECVQVHVAPRAPTVHTVSFALRHGPE
jgi:hypothetical protein